MLSSAFSVIAAQCCCYKQATSIYDNIKEKFWTHLIRVLKPITAASSKIMFPRQPPHWKTLQKILPGHVGAPYIIQNRAAWIITAEFLACLAKGQKQQQKMEAAKSLQGIFFPRNSVKSLKSLVLHCFPSLCALSTLVTHNTNSPMVWISLLASAKVLGRLSHLKYVPKNPGE